MFESGGMPGGGNSGLRGDGGPLLSDENRQHVVYIGGRGPATSIGLNALPRKYCLTDQSTRVRRGKVEESRFWRCLLPDGRDWQRCCQDRHQIGCKRRLTAARRCFWGLFWGAKDKCVEGLGRGTRQNSSHGFCTECSKCVAEFDVVRQGAFDRRC